MFLLERVDGDVNSTRGHRPQTAYPTHPSTTSGEGLDRETFVDTGSQGKRAVPLEPPVYKVYHGGRLPSRKGMRVTYNV